MKTISAILASLPEPKFNGFYFKDEAHFAKYYRELLRKGNNALRQHDHATYQSCLCRATICDRLSALKKLFEEMRPDANALL